MNLDKSFESLEYSNALESDKEAKEWLLKNKNRLDRYIDAFQKKPSKFQEISESFGEDGISRYRHGLEIIYTSHSEGLREVLSIKSETFL